MATTYCGRVQVKGALNRGKLNFRESENLTSQVLAEIPDGTELDVTLGSSKRFFRTTYNNQTGYVKASEIAITEGGYPLYRVNTESGPLNIRETPNSGSGVTVLFTAAKDKGLYVLGSSSDWYLVSCNIGTGWAKKTYLVQDSNVTPFDYLTIDEFIERLKSFCGKGWSYKLGYSSVGKTIDCANYPYVARHSLGAHNVKDEYADIESDEKGSFTDPSQLEKGMEVFQYNTSESNWKHMGVYAGVVTFPNGETRHAVYQSRAAYNANQLAMYSEKTGPNLTEMNNDWNYFGWSKYIKH